MINRILGFIPRMLLPRVIGPEGIGLYQMGYPFLIVVLTVITGGIPIAVAKLVAAAEAEGNEMRARGIFRLALALSLSLSLLFMATIALEARWITAHLFTDERVYYTFLCMTPIIPLAAVSAVYRGYFQGRQNMIPSAVSQVTETVVRIIAVLAFAYYLLPKGIEYAAAGAMIGVLAGEAGALLVLYGHYRSDRKSRLLNNRTKIGTHRRFAAKANLKQLLKLAIPVTGSKLTGSGSYFFESILIVHSLAAAGIATKLATAQYGVLQGMVIPVLLLPSALTYSLAVSLVPSLSEAAARGDMKTIHTRLHQSLKVALVTGAPFAVLMFILAEPICALMYGQPAAGAMLRMMAPAALFIYFQAPLQAALQALDKPGAALMNTLIGACCKLSLIWLLASRPEFGILGAVMAICVNIMLVTLLHWSSISRLLRFRMNAGDFIKVGISMAGSGVIGYALYAAPWTEHHLAKFAASCGGVMAAYATIALLLGLFDRGDLLRLLSLGKKLVK